MASAAMILTLFCTPGAAMWDDTAVNEYGALSALQMRHQNNTKSDSDSQLSGMFTECNKNGDCSTGMARCQDPRFVAQTAVWCNYCHKYSICSEVSFGGRTMSHCACAS